jgi:hypothetical protein|eukprot:g3150.t1
MHFADGQIDHVGIDAITTADEVTPEELEKYLSKLGKKKESASDAASGSLDFDVFVSSSVNTYSDPKTPGEPVVLKGKPVQKFNVAKAVKNGTRHQVPRGENRQEVYMRSKDKMILQNVGILQVNCVEKKRCRAFSSRIRTSPSLVKGLDGVWQIKTYITYMCRKEGMSPVSFSITKRSSRGGNGPSGYALSWNKACGNGPLYGFNVELRDKIGENNGEVIKDGNPAPEFLSYLVSSRGFNVGFQESSTGFIVKGPPKDDKYMSEEFQLDFNISNIKISNVKPKAAQEQRGRREPKILAVMIDGEASGGGTLSAGDEVPLILRYDCLESGTATVEVEFSVHSRSGAGGAKDKRPASFAFKKVCHVGPLPGFDIAISGVELGSDFFAVKDGKPLASFSPTDHTARVSAKETALNLELLMARPMIALDFHRPSVSVIPLGGGNKKMVPFSEVVDKIVGPHSIFGGGGSIFDRIAPVFKRIRDIGIGGARPPPPPPIPLPGGDDEEDSDEDDDNFDGPGGVRRRLWRPKHSGPTEIVDIRNRDRILEVALTGDAALGGTIMSNSSSMLTIIHDCKMTGSAIIKVKIPLKRPRAQMSIKKSENDDEKAFFQRVVEKLKQMRNERVIEFAYVKECKSGPVPGFDVSLGQVMTTGVKAFYPVKSGVITPSYRASRTEMRVREGEKVSRVYFSEKMPGTKVEISKLSVLTHPRIGNQVASEILDARLRVMGAVGSSTEDQFSRGGKPFTILGPKSFMRSVTRRWTNAKIVEIEYNCKASGLAKLFFSFHVAQYRLNRKTKKYTPTYGGPRQFTVGWVKECHVPAAKGFNVKVRDSRDQTGLAVKGVSAVKDGTPTKKFAPNVHSWLYGAHLTSAFLYLTSEANNTMVFEPPIVSVNNEAVEVSLSGPGSKSLKLSRRVKPVELRIDFECVTFGSSIVSLTFPLRPSLDEGVDLPSDAPADINFAFTKKCKPKGALEKRASRKRLLLICGVVAIIVLIFLGFFAMSQRSRIQDLMIKLKHSTKAKYKKVKVDDDDEDTKTDKEIELRSKK